MDNIGMTCLEELGDLSDVITHDQKKPVQKRDNVKPFTKPANKEKPAVQVNAKPEVYQEQPPVIDNANVNVPVEAKPVAQVPKTERKTKAAKPDNGPAAALPRFPHSQSGTSRDPPDVGSAEISALQPFPKKRHLR